MKRYELIKGTSRKFWEIGRSGAKVTVRWGRIGGTPSEKVHTLGSDQKAKTAYDKLVTEKTNKGYQLAGSAAKPAVKATKTASTSKSTAKSRVSAKPTSKRKVSAKPKVSAKITPTTAVRGKAGRLFDVTADPVTTVDLATLKTNLGGLPIGPVMRELVTLCEATLPSSPAEAFSLLGKYGELVFESFVNPHEQIGFRLRSPRHRPFASDHKDVINFLVEAGTSTTTARSCTTTS